MVPVQTCPPRVPPGFSPLPADLPATLPLPRVEETPAANPRVVTFAPEEEHIPVPDPLPRVEPAPAAVPRVGRRAPAPAETYAQRTGNPGRRRRQAKAKTTEKATARAKANSRPSSNSTQPTQRPSRDPTSSPASNTRSQSLQKTSRGVRMNRHAANHVMECLEPPPPAPSPAPTTDEEEVPAHAYWTANSVVCEKTGKALEYAQLKLGEDGKEWIGAAANEIGRLTQGNGKAMPTGTNTMHFIHHSQKPAGRKATYLRIVSALKPHKKEKRRIRFTVGGDRIDYKGNVSTPTSDLTTVKILLNSVVSTPGAQFMTNDIQDFYLESEMPRYEYMWIPVKDIPDCIMEQYKLEGLIHNGMILVKIRKGMYGLPQAGILAHERLVKHLSKYDYFPTQHTPGLFLHKTRPITFSLVVDDFGVMYEGREHAQHLIDTLEALYKITTDWSGTQYCGLTLDWDYKARTVDLSMPKYVQAALTKFQHHPNHKAQHSPHAWTKPNYGAPTQLTAPSDTSAPLDAAGLTRLQEVVGTLLYYARALDSTMLVALGTIASAQAKGTEQTADAVTQLLNYAATHPDAIVRYHASDMQLHVHSDASYLSESKARSRAGGTFFLSSLSKTPTVAPDPNSTPPPHNGAIHTHCSIMKSVLSSATEAELGALFYNAKDGAWLRTTLESMGHPQQATPIQTDNACASGIANNTVKQRRSKAIDMRFYWIKDRVQQGQFLVHWRRGTDNLADYFTKHHSPTHHRLMRSRYLLELDQPVKPNSQRGCVDILP